MPEQMPDKNRLIAMVMIVSAVTLFGVSSFTYTGILPVPEIARPLIGGVVGAAAFVDLLVGIWFFRKGQSS